MARKQTNQTPQEEKAKKEPVIYTGETIANERFFLKTGQIFTEIPAYVKDEEIRKKFIPLSQVKKK